MEGQHNDKSKIILHEAYTYLLEDPSMLCNVSSTESRVLLELGADVVEMPTSLEAIFT